MQARTEEYARLLRRFDASELDEAYTDVLQTWDSMAWPPPGRFFTAAMDRRKETAGSAASQPSRSERERAMVQYLEDGTAWPSGLGMPHKHLISARVAGLEAYGLAKGKRERLPREYALRKAREILGA